MKKESIYQIKIFGLTDLSQPLPKLCNIFFFLLVMRGLTRLCEKIKYACGESMKYSASPLSQLAWECKRFVKRFGQLMMRVLLYYSQWFYHKLAELPFLTEAHFFY